MKKNILEKVFEEFGKSSVRYGVRTSSYKGFPYKIEGKDVDLLIERKDFLKSKMILKKLGFIFYRHTEPYYMFYGYGKELGLIQIDILLIDKLPNVKRYKKFFVLEDLERGKRRRKSEWERIKTGLRRRFYYLGRGKLICFIGPDGSGKTTSMKNTLRELEIFPIRKKSMLFGDLKPGAVDRFVARIVSLIKVYWNLFLGRITITDRYIYLTFRKKNRILRRLLRAIAPKPDIVFVMKADYETLKKRRGVEALDEKTVSDLYKLFEEIKGAKTINTEDSKSNNIGFVMSEILKLYR